MTNSRASFLQTNLAIERCLDIKETVYKSPSDICHNDSARVLRNGLAVVVFASLESFARDRIGEILSRISLTSIPFDDLPDKLRILRRQSASRCDISNRSPEEAT